MAVFPNELLAEICSYGDNSTLKQLRLVNRALDICAAKFLFEDIALILLPDSIAKIREIIRHRVFRRYVRSLVYCAERLNPEYETYLTWHDAALHVSTYEVPAGVKVAWHRFCRLRSEQYQLVQNGNEAQLLKEILGALPKLDSFCLAEAAGRVCAEPKCTSLYESIARSCLLDAESAFTDAELQVPQLSALTSAHVAVFRALDNRGELLKSVSFADIPYLFWDDSDQNAFLSTIRPHLALAFSGIEHLKFSTEVRVMRKAELWCGEAGKKSLQVVSLLCCFLSRAPGLRLLDMHIDNCVRAHSRIGDSIDLPHRTKITDVLTVLVWEHLHTLQLANCSADTDVFITFLKRHAKKLTSLTFQNVRLLDLPQNPFSNAANSADATPRTNIPVLSAWERAFKQLAPHLDRPIVTLYECTDKLLMQRVNAHNGEGIPVDHLVDSWNDELALYVEDWTGQEWLCPYFPIYGEPRPLDMSTDEEYEL